MTSTQTTTLTGAAAIDYALEHDVALCKYTDPTEPAREGLTPDEARAIADVDPGLIYVEAEIDCYEVVIGADEWGLDEAVSSDEHHDACDRMEAYLTEHEGDLLSIRVRPVRRGEIAGTYRVRSNGDTQILGHSIPEPEMVRELRMAAYEHACETWPSDSDIVLVEAMPRHLRASHEAAGNRGAYPHNGAERWLVERRAAQDAYEGGDGWVRILRAATEADMAAYERNDAFADSL